MRLGVSKELKPKMVATFSDRAGSHEGHPFLIEAAVSIGKLIVNAISGQNKNIDGDNNTYTILHYTTLHYTNTIGGDSLGEGINIYRFANRIPLLFEGGGDVCTKCSSNLNWRNYHIDKNKDQIGMN